jgi:hypothetical protein
VSPRKYATPAEAKQAAKRQREEWRAKFRAAGKCIDCGAFIGTPPQPCRCPACTNVQSYRGVRGRERVALAESIGKVPTFEDFERLYQ